MSLEVVILNDFHLEFEFLVGIVIGIVPTFEYFGGIEFVLNAVIVVILVFTDCHLITTALYEMS